MSILKKVVRSALRRTGHQIQKYPRSPFRSAPVFDVTVQLLMATRGPDVAFIQVGAHNGHFGDPLRRYIAEYPWHGILVEPQPDVFGALQTAYAAEAERLVFENVAISSAVSSITMYRAPGHESRRGDPEWAASVVSTRPEVVSRQLGITEALLERFVVPATTLDRLVAKHDLDDLQVLQIDTEGSDFEVMKTLDLATVSPAIIQFEHGHLPPAELDRAVAHLTAHGYRVLYGGHQMDTVAMHDTFIEAVT